MTTQTDDRGHEVAKAWSRFLRDMAASVRTEADVAALGFFTANFLDLVSTGLTPAEWLASLHVQSQAAVVQ